MTVDRNRRVLLLALLLAATSALLAYQLIASRLAPPPAVVEVTPETGEPVLVAARFIPEGTALTASDIKVVYVDPAAKADRGLTDSAQVMDQVALADIPEGEQILAGSIGDADESTLREQDTFASEVPVGMRAVTIATEETVGVGGLVQPGDRVDVIAGFELDLVQPPVGTQREGESEGQSADPFPMAELILQDVEVMAIGQAMQSTAAAAPAPDPNAPAAEGAPAGPITRPEALSVTLLVNPAEALRLLLAVQAGGTFRLLLRAPGDTATTELPPALITNGAAQTEPFALVGANLPTGGLIITSARFEHDAVPAGGVLEFEVMVRNVSPERIPAGSGGANVGYVYNAGVTWETVAASTQPGAFSIALTSETADQVTYPWRWDIGKDLAPGESTTVTGGVQVPNLPGTHRWWFGIMRQPGTVVEDGVRLAEITIEPAVSVVVITPEISLREAPWPDAPVVQTAARGTTANVLDYRDGWFLIRAGDSEGWAPEGFVVNSVLPAAAAIAEASPEAEEESQ